MKAGEKSNYVQVMDEVQAELKPWLEMLGFVCYGRACNRKTAEGLTQVIGFQMGPFYKPRFYGRFTVNLGVHVPEAYEWLGHDALKKYVKDYQCLVHERLGRAGPERRDMWWKLKNGNALAKEMRIRLERDALPLLDRFATRDAILNELQGNGTSISCINPRLVCAAILAARGKKEEASVLLTRQAQETRIPKHREYVCAVAERAGIPLGDITEKQDDGVWQSIRKFWRNAQK